MTTITMEPPTRTSRGLAARALLAAALIAVLLITFAIGRVTSPAKTEVVRSVVTVPAPAVTPGPADVPLTCHLGSAC